MLAAAELASEVEAADDVELASEVELAGSPEVELDSAGEVELAAVPDADVICGPMDEAKPSPGPPPHVAARRQVAQKDRRMRPMIGPGRGEVTRPALSPPVSPAKVWYCKGEMEADARMDDMAKLYTFAVWMLNDRAEGLRRAAEVVRAAPDLGFVQWVGDLIARLSGAKGRKGPKTRRLPERQIVLSALDEILRTDLTVTAGDHPEVQRDPRRLRVLQWELKRTCLAAVLQGLAPWPRATFVLTKILGLSLEQMTAMFGVTAVSVTTNLARGAKVLNEYLSVRCQHLALGNSCRCETRLGVALAHGFVRWPSNPHEAPDSPVYSQANSDVGLLYRSLPEFSLDDAARRTLCDAVSVPVGSSQ